MLWPGIIHDVSLSIKPFTLSNLIYSNPLTLFTDKKVLICDKQGITGKKTEYYAIPYNKIVTYAIETAGHFDIDSEIKLFLTGGIEIEMNFLRGKNMDQLLGRVFNVINEYATL